MTRVGPQRQRGGGKLHFTVIFRYHYEHNRLLKEDINTVT